MNNKQTITILTILTAVIHLAIAFSPLNVLFILNGLGYLALLAGFAYLPQLASQRSLIRWLFMGFTTLTIILYFVLQGSGAFSNVLGLGTKAIELALLLFLWHSLDTKSA